MWAGEYARQRGKFLGEAAVLYPGPLTEQPPPYRGARSGRDGAKGGGIVEVGDDGEGGLGLLRPEGGGPGVERGGAVGEPGAGVRVLPAGVRGAGGHGKRAGQETGGAGRGPDA